MPLFTNEDVVSGSVDANITNPSLAVTGPLTDTELRATAVPVSGPLTDTQLRATPVPVTQGVSSVSTVTLVVSSASAITLLAANPNRARAIFFVEGSTQYIKLGSGAATNSYTYKVSANNTYVEIEGYTGIVTVIGTAGKNILVTELAYA